MSVFHAGERAIQQRAGFGDAALTVGERFIRGVMPEQHQVFFAQLPFVVVGVLDAQGQARAGLLAGAPGFMNSPDDRHLDIQAGAVVGEGVAERLTPGAQIGLLGIEAHTRRRNRLNGLVADALDGRVSVRVTQSFGNCPKYIYPRRIEWAPMVAGVKRVVSGWDADARRMVAAADTFFIATAHPEAADASAAAHGVDVSHRGGEAGFVCVRDATLSVPDYPGNRFFNTLGNLELNPWAGLLFIDFEARSFLQLAVRARLEWLPPSQTESKGNNRVLHFDVLAAQRTEGVLPLVLAAQ
ncbi:pyridoxamine 5'-phosphate oxidase family protein [Zoogloeaceae bacterium G21618-S1]|nr:pyridoxamine 5'-phosphate oxidase family protein [Zoogloeaceae bacterium G21618-S1]